MTNIERAQEIYFALEERNFDLDPSEFRAVIEAALDDTEQSVNTALLAALTNLLAWATIQDYHSPQAVELRDAARAAIAAAGGAASDAGTDDHRWQEAEDAAYDRMLYDENLPDAGGGE